MPTCAVCERSNRDTARFCRDCRAPLLLQSKYRITRLLGKGGYGAVYLGEQLHLGNVPCAVKELFSDPSATPEQRQQYAAQFQFEASVLAGLHHPALPRVTDFFQEGGHYYLIMDYVEGETLEELLVRNGTPLPERDVIAWMDELLGALHYLHNHTPAPVVHRDIKPSNIKITRDGNVKLIDFGIAKLLGTGTGAAARAVSPPYAPTEQYGRGKGGTDARTDIYAVGATMYQLLTNRLPPEAPDRAHEPVVGLRQLNPTLSAGIEVVALKAMAERPLDRFQTALAMQQSLRAVAAGAVPSFQPPAPVSALSVPTQPTPTDLGTGALPAQGKSLSGLVWIAATGLVIAAIIGGMLVMNEISKQQAATATAVERATATAAYHAPVATVQSTATANVQATATAVAVATEMAQARATETAQARASTTAQVQASATARVYQTATAQARAIATAAAAATETAFAELPVTVTVINNFRDMQDVWADGQFFLRIELRSTASAQIRKGVHTFQICWRGQKPPDCGNPWTVNLQRDYTLTIRE